MDRARDVAFGALLRGSHVQHEVFGGAAGGDLVPLGQSDQAPQIVLGRLPGQVDGVLGRAEGRRVGQFEFGQIVDRQVGLEGGGEDVEALVNASGADRLRAEEPAGLGGKENLQGQRLGTRIIAGVVGRVEVEGLVGDGGLWSSRSETSGISPPTW